MRVDFHHRDDALTIACAGCPVRDLHCGDCMVTALIDPASMGLTTHLPLDRDEKAAVSACVRAGLISAEAAREVRAEPVETQIGRAVS